MSNPPTIDLLLNLVPDRPDTVLTQLHLHPHLASARDAHGYSLLHASISYNHPTLFRSLITEFKVDPNLTDEDDETCLFNAESVEIAKVAVEMGVNAERRNGDGVTAGEKLSGDEDCVEVGKYLLGLSGAGSGEEKGGEGNGGVQRPPTLPDGVKVELGTMLPEENGEEPDPEIRRRIEELAARGDFEGEDGQRELRSLVQDVVSGMKEEEVGNDRSRRRVG